MAYPAHIEAIKEVLAQAMNKYFQFSNNIMLLKTVVTVPIVCGVMAALLEYYLFLSCR